jgi:hypothetical protein
MENGSRVFIGKTPRKHKTRSGGWVHNRFSHKIQMRSSEHARFHGGGNICCLNCRTSFTFYQIQDFSCPFCQSSVFPNPINK